MADTEKKKKILIDGKNFEPDPSFMDRLKEGFETTDTRAQLEAVRKRRAAQFGS